VQTTNLQQLHQLLHAIPLKVEETFNRQQPTDLDSLQLIRNNNSPKMRLRILYYAIIGSRTWSCWKFSSCRLSRMTGAFLLIQKQR